MKPAFSSFTAMLSTHLKENFCLKTSILSFAIAFNSDQSKNLSFDKELNKMDILHGTMREAPFAREWPICLRT